jgi:predicted RND superfamily exporter protein
LSLERFVGFLTSRGRLISIGALLLVTLLFARAALEVGVERGTESMQADDPVQRETYAAFTKRFGSDDLLLMSVTHPRLLHGDGLMLLDALSRRIESLPGVARVRSLTHLDEIVPGAGGATPTPLVPRPLSRTSLPEPIEAALDRNPQWTDLLVSEDRRTAGITIEVETSSTDPDLSLRLIDTLRGMMREPAYAESELHLTGIAAQKHDVARFIERDQILLLPLSGLVLATALAFVFRRKSGVLLPMLVTAATLVWTLGLYALTGHELNIITSLLPPVIMVLAITTSMHLYQRWIVLARHIEPGPELIHRVVWSLLGPCCLAGITTAIGLASLGVSDIPAVRQFGLFAAAGILVSLLLNFTIMPIGLSFLRPRPKRHVGSGDRTGRLLSSFAAISLRRPLLVLGLTAMVAITGVAGMRQVRNNTDLVRFLSTDSELYRDTIYIDDHLTGSNSLELMLERRDGAPLTALEDVRRIAALQEGLLELDEITAGLSFVDLIRQLHRAEQEASELRLPIDSDDLLYCFDLIEAADAQDDVARLITPEFTAARVSIRLHAIGTSQAQRVLERIDGIARATLGPDYLLQPAGSFYQLTLDSNRLVYSQLRSFMLALALVLLVMGLVFRSTKLLLAATIPNLLPIVSTAGLMGWLGIDLSTATTMIASVAIGIAVDDTIHYVARFRAEQRHGNIRAIRRTTLGTGRVLVMTSTVLALGFWVGAFSSFRPTVYFSLLTGVTILLALASDLLVLPACLHLLRPRPSGENSVA